MEKNNQLLTRERVTKGLHLRANSDGTPSRTIEGYAIVFNEESLPMWEDADETAVEVIAPEAVTRELLDMCDIRMTMYHSNKRLLARSNKGTGTLSYDVDATGVRFTFEAPKTPTGDEAVDLVSRGDIAGCSFAFRCSYGEPDVTYKYSETDGKRKCTFTVHRIKEIQDFTLTDDPAYPSTEVEVRARGMLSPKPASDYLKQIDEMNHQITPAEL